MELTFILSNILTTCNGNLSINYPHTVANQFRVELLHFFIGLFVNTGLKAAQTFFRTQMVILDCQGYSRIYVNPTQQWTNYQHIIAIYYLSIIDQKYLSWCFSESKNCMHSIGCFVNYQTIFRIFCNFKTPNFFLTIYFF